MLSEIIEENGNNNDVIDSIKYYYFGRIYTIIHSRQKLEKKKESLFNILDEINSDILLKNPALEKVKEGILLILFSKIDNIKNEIEIKNFKIHFSFGIIKSKIFNR